MGCIICKTCKQSCQDIGRAIKRGSMDLKRLRKSTENEENDTEMKTVTESPEDIESPEEDVESLEEDIVESPETFPGERVEEDSPSEHSKDSDISQNPSVCGSDFEFVN